jgi:protein SCO1/2
MTANGPGPRWRRRAAILLIAAIALAPLDAVAQPTGAPSVAGGPFTLTATDGSTVTEASFRGKWLLVYFGYTSCPDVCPATLLEIGMALERLGADAAKVQPLFVTVDPRRDTAKILADYLRSFDPRILALTGTPEQIMVAARAYRVFYERHDDDNGGYSYDHSTFVYMIDPQGRLATALGGDTSGGRIAQELSARMNGPR